MTVTEMPWLWAGLMAYAGAMVVAFRGVWRGTSVGAAVATVTYERWVLLALVTGVVLLATALGVRWERLGHGPFVNLFELLMSQLFSLGLIYSVIYWRVPVLRPSAVVVMPLIWLLGSWILTLEPADSRLPPTYYNAWLWVHVGFGKIFLSFCLVAAGLAGVMLLRTVPRFSGLLKQMPDHVLDQMAWRFMMLALVFDSLMLVAGSVWAQDAWGRYWSWDALETSAFITWLSIGGGIHARLSYKIPARIAALAILAIFGLAFMTYFGTPYFSEAAHKGVI